MSSHSALVLSGGGARGAYQAGVIQAFEEILRAERIEFPKIISGVSAGSINGAFLASEAANLPAAVPQLVDTWRQLSAEQVFRTDYGSVSSNALRFIRGVSLGGVAGAMRPNRLGLLNTDPLAELLSDKISFEKIKQQIQQGHLKALSITATDYSTSIGVTFVQGGPEISAWRAANRFSVLTEIDVNHVMGSTAIPLFFPAVQISGRFFGDGCLRNTAPLSPAVHLGANKLLIVGVRRQPALEDFEKPTLSPSLGRVLSVLINAIFLDSVEVDLDRLKSINESLDRLGPHQHVSKYQTVSAFFMRPSRDLAELAKQSSGELPRIIRFLFGGLGSREESAELLSYLLFEPTFCSQLVQLGYEDAYNRKDELVRFLSA